MVVEVGGQAARPSRASRAAGRRATAWSRTKSSARRATGAGRGRARARRAARPRIISAFQLVRTCRRAPARGDGCAPQQLCARRRRARAGLVPRSRSPRRSAPAAGRRAGARRLLEVRLAVQAEAGREHGYSAGVTARAPRRASRRRTCPRALGVGVELEQIAAVRALHVAQHPVRGLAGDAREQLVAGGDRGLRVERQQRAVVVQHLLEVRDRPVAVDRVAAEAAAELVVDAALGHALQRERRHVERLRSGSVPPRSRASGAAGLEWSGAGTWARRRSRRTRRRTRAAATPARASGARQARAPARAGAAQFAEGLHQRALWLAMSAPCSRVVPATRCSMSLKPGRPCAVPSGK